MKSDLELFKEKYGYNKGDLRYIPEGADILKYIGVEVIFVEFTKINNEWTNKIKKAIINEITDYDPMTLTYLCKYRLVDEDKENSWRELRIIPEGFSFNQPEIEGKMYRFIPYSLHCKMAEDEALYNRLSILYAKRDTMILSNLENLSVSKEQDKTLNYAMNIGLVIKTIDNNILWFRISKLSLKHKYKNVYSLRVENKNNKNYTIEITGDQKEYKFIYNGTEIGSAKIIDLACLN